MIGRLKVRSLVGNTAHERARLEKQFVCFATAKLLIDFFQIVKTYEEKEAALCAGPRGIFSIHYFAKLTHEEVAIGQARDGVMIHLIIQDRQPRGFLDNPIVQASD